MSIVKPRRTAVVALALVASSVAVMAQSRPELPDAGSVAALTAEIRQLRLAVEEATRSQTQTQALGVYLSVQQARLVQVASRVDAARKDLDAATLRSRELAARLATMTDALQRSADPAERLALSDASQGLKREQDGAAVQQQLARARDAELSQMLQTEDARWSDLIARLEQLIRR